MTRMRLTSSGALEPADAARRDTRRGRHREPGRQFRSLSSYQRLRARVFREETCCALCGSTDEPNLDHIVPVKHGGAKLDRANARRLCGPCNRRRGASGGGGASPAGPGPHPASRLARTESDVAGLISPAGARG